MLNEYSHKFFQLKYLLPAIQEWVGLYKCLTNQFKTDKLYFKVLAYNLVLIKTSFLAERAIYA